MVQAIPEPPPGSPPQAAAQPILSPVPTNVADLERARDYLAAQIGMEAPATQEVAPDLVERLDALMAGASALVEKEGPTAPQAVRNECVVRFCGYLRQSDYGGIRAEAVGEGAKSTEYVTNHAGAFRNCGAKALLSPFVVRRAGSIG